MLSDHPLLVPLVASTEEGLVTAGLEQKDEDYQACDSLSTSSIPLESHCRTTNQCDQDSPYLYYTQK